MIGPWNVPFCLMTHFGSRFTAAVLSEALLCQPFRNVIWRIGISRIASLLRIHFRLVSFAGRDVFRGRGEF
jgi:hypothetical protein